MAALDRDAVTALIERARREIDEGLLPSCQFAIAVDGELAELHTLGDTPRGDDTRYVVFSATKAIVSAAVLQALGEGSLRPDTRVADLIPEFATNGKEAVTVEQVMLYTSGFPTAPLGPPDWATTEGRRAAFSRWRATSTPGERYEYHTTSAHWVLAELLASVDGVDFREAVRRRIAEPLGLKGLGLGTPVEDQDDIARVALVGEPASEQELMEALGVPEIPRGEVTDDALAAFADPGVIEVGLPGGGAVSGAADFALFYQALLQNPNDLWDRGVLADATGNVRITAFDAIRGVPANRTVAFLVAGDDGKAAARGFGHNARPNAFGHDGMGGQIAYADPDTGTSFVYLTDGMDRHLLRQQRRRIGIASRAELCARP